MMAVYVKALLSLSLIGLVQARSAAAQAGAPWDAVVTSEYIFETAPFRSCHASTIAETGDGLVAAWFGGSREAAPDVGIWLSRHVDGAWTAPVEVADGQFGDKRYSSWNPVLFQPKNGPLMLFYKSGTGGPGWFGVMMTSDDAGKTWSKPRRLPDGILGPIKNKPILLDTGVILAGSSTEDAHGWRVHVERTSDWGQTWEATPPLNDGDEIGVIQPTLLTYPDGRIQMLSRTRSEYGFLAQSWSEDGGRTWSPMERSVLPNNNSGIDGVTLADGRQLLVYNHSTREQPGMGHKGRGILNVAVSRDGIAWEAALILEHLDQSGKQFSYPAVIQTSDGLVHIVYTWHRERIKHVVLDPARLVTRPMPGGTWPSDGPHSLIAEGSAPGGTRYRVLVSTDIGGTDPDDFQSMAHLLLYADVLDIEGLISSPFGPGRKAHILEVIDYYERDYANLKSHSDKYPTPDALRALTKQGATERAGYSGVGAPTEGSQWIVERARADDPRPLHVLIWGGLEDLAQALHDAPDIVPKLRVYWIGGPNKKWSPDAYQYIADHHPALWMIEANATYRGWFVGGNQAGPWSNAGFVEAHVAGKGALGAFFAGQLGGEIKMGDTPSVGWLLEGTPGDPAQPGWGGRFVRAWDRPYDRFDRMTTEADRMQAFGILELALPLGAGAPEQPEARLEVDNQSLAGHLPGDGTVRFRFSPKGAGTYAFTIRSNVPALDGKTGGITAFTPPPEAAQRPSAKYPNWWTDDPSPHLAEDGHIGARTVSRWREDFLRDFAERMLRCAAPASPHTAPPQN